LEGFGLFHVRHVFASSYLMQQSYYRMSCVSSIYLPL
jgi:hypothetical protein